MNFNNFYPNLGKGILYKLPWVFVIFLQSHLTSAQLLKQVFSTPVAKSSGTILNSGVYCSTPPSNVQFNSIGSSGPGSSFEVPSATGKLTFKRSADKVGFTRSTDFGPIPTTMMYRFDLTVSGNSVASTNAARFQVGFGFNPNLIDLETDVNTNSRLGINWTAVPGQFSLRNGLNNASSINFSGTQTVLWVINNSDAASTYMGPNGVEQTLANDRNDVWIGQTLVFDEMAMVTNIRWLRNLKFIQLDGNATIELDNILVDPYPISPTALAQSFCASNNPKIANLIGSGTNLKWYTAISGGTALATTTPLATGTYFVSQTPNGFESRRVPVSIVVEAGIGNNVLTPSQTVCTGTIPALINSGVLIGGNGIFSCTWETATSPAGPFTPNSATTPSLTPSATVGSVWYRRTVSSGTCNSISIPVSVTVQALPTVSAGSALPSISQGGTTVALGGSFGGSATGAVWSASVGSFTNNLGATPATTKYTATAASPSSMTLKLTSIGGVCPAVFVTKLLTVSVAAAATTNGTLTGVVNRYAEVVGPSIIPAGSFVCTLATGEGSQFASGDRAMIIQMKGATVNLPSSPDDITYGYLIGMGNSGNHEFLWLDSVKGDVIRFKKSLLKSYDVAGKVQIVRIPQYTGNQTVKNSTSISSIKLAKRGMGYAPNATITTGFTITPTNGGTGLQLRAFTDALGQMTEVQILNAGSGYNSPPTITLPTPTVAPLNLTNYRAKAIAITGLTGIQWNGKKGGILAFEVNGNLILQDSIRMSGMGFAGGMIGDKAAVVGTCASSKLYGLAWSNISQAGQKGEGITTIPDAALRGRGRYGLSGGGGMEPEAGGGGGANWQDGGRGGSSSYIQVPLSKCSTTVSSCDKDFTKGGLGGNTNPMVPAGFKNTLRANSYYYTPIAYIRIFLGAGGGGGHALNDALGMQSGGAGGNGGGMVIIKANDLKSGNFKIKANGDNGEDAIGDGAGGGGGGGAIIIKVNTYSDLVKGRINGGNGGNAKSIICDYGNGAATDKKRLFGAGGGGGGGVVWLAQPDVDVTALAIGCNLSQSNNGQNDDPVNNSAQKGNSARSQSELVMLENSPVTVSILRVGNMPNADFPNLNMAADWLTHVGSTKRNLTILLGETSKQTNPEANPITFGMHGSARNTQYKSVSIQSISEQPSILLKNEAGNKTNFVVDGLESLVLRNVNLSDSKDKLVNSISVQNGGKIVFDQVAGKANIKSTEIGNNQIQIKNLRLEGNLILEKGSSFAQDKGSSLELINGSWTNNGARSLGFGLGSEVVFTGSDGNSLIDGLVSTKFENVSVNAASKLTVDQNVEAKNWIQKNEAVTDLGRHTLKISEKISADQSRIIGNDFGKVLVSGTSPVEVSGRFHRLELDAHSIASANVFIDQNLNLKKGRLDLNQFEMNLLSPESSALTFSGNSWINGKLNRRVSAGQNYAFPVGTKTNHEVANLKLMSIENGLEEISIIFDE